MFLHQNYIAIPTVIFFFFILNVKVTAVEIPSLGDLRPDKFITIDVSNYTEPLSNHGQLVFYEEFNLNSYTLSTIDIINFNHDINSDFDYGIVQVHSCFYNISISFDKTFKDDAQEYGMNLGLIVRASDNFNDDISTNDQKNHTIYIENKIYFTNVSIAVGMVIYKHRQPVPGGCDLTDGPPNNDKQIHPILNIQSNAEMIIVDTPPASRFGDIGDNECDNPFYTNELRYTHYRLYLKRGDISCTMFFTGIRQMLTVDLVQQNGLVGNQWPKTEAVNSRSSYTTLPGTGMVFSTIVQDLSDESMAAYVPIYTISCTPPFWESKCDIFASLEFRVLTVILIVLGIIRAYGGIFLFVLGVAIDGFVIGALSSFYIFFYLCADYQVAQGTEYWIIVGSGIGFAILLTGLYFLFPPGQFISELATTIICGYIFSTFVTYLFDETDVTNRVWWIECLFVLIICLIFCCIPPIWSWSGILLAVGLGTFAIVQGIMFLMGTHSSYILINPFRSVRLNGYRYVNTAPDLLIENIILIVIACIIFGTGILFQWQMKRSGNCLANGGGNRPARYQCRSDGGLFSERTPLLTRMTQGSDDVFESPQTNYRYFERLRRSQRRMALRARPQIHQID